MELMIVITIGSVLTCASLVALMTSLNEDHVDQAYNTTLSVMRTYRNLAITQGNRYIVTFYNNTPASCTVANPTCLQVQIWGFNSATQTNMAPTTVFTYVLPSDIQFATQAAFPAATPDGFSNSTTPIWTQHVCNVTEGGESCVVFSPDGSAQDDTGGVTGASCPMGTSCYTPGNYNNALVYITRPASTAIKSRAISIWGATGIVRGWRLNNEGGSNYWVEQ